VPILTVNMMVRYLNMFVKDFFGVVIMFGTALTLHNSNDGSCLQLSFLRFFYSKITYISPCFRVIYKEYSDLKSQNKGM
jgi:hypothetical protein